MALPLRPRATPQCSACIRNYAFSALSEPAATGSALGHQVRGKKKLANSSNTVPVRLLKDVKTFGRRGAIVPISIGQMRNDWFPRHIAAYITLPELKTLRLKNIAAERDFDYGVTNLAREAAAMGVPGGAGALLSPHPADARGAGMSRDEKVAASMFQKKVETSKLSPARSAELLEIFVPRTLEFWRQPILEEREPEPEVKPEAKKASMRGFGMGAGAELLAARASAPEVKPAKAAGPQAIYGSVSTGDVLNAVKAVMAENDEAARVVVQGEEVRFLDLAGEDADRVKTVGEFAVEIMPKGAEKSVRRTVRVNAQQA